MKEKISVIIPVYNVGAYVEKCIESVCRQTYEELEIILVDDGSTDSSGKICDEWAENDNRIVVLHQENRGLSGARNAGLEKATGEYVTFLDSDDYIAPTTYEEMLRAGKQFQADVTISGFQKVYHSDEETVTGDGSVVCVTGREAAAKLYASKDEYLLTVVAWNKLYRKEALPEDFSFPEGRIHEDEYTSYRLIYPLSKVVYLDRRLIYYRQRKDSIVHSKFSLKRLDALPVLKEAIRYFEGKSDYELANKALKRYLNFIMTSYDNVKKYLKEQNTLLSLRKEFQSTYKKYKKEIRSFPFRRRVLYHLFLYNRPLYLIIVKMRG